MYALVEAGASVDFETTRRRTALALACVQGSEDAIHKCIGLGADVNRVNNDGMSTLILAAEAQAVEAIRVLIRAGADVDYRADRRAGDAAGHTALSWASARMKLQVVQAITGAAQGGTAGLV